jgi:hypothetical protein
MPAQFRPLRSAAARPRSARLAADVVARPRPARAPFLFMGGLRDGGQPGPYAVTLVKRPQGTVAAQRGNTFAVTSDLDDFSDVGHLQRPL